MVYLSSSSDGSAYGGVVVFRSGSNVGVAELTDAQVDQVGDTDLMKSLAAIALFRVKIRAEPSGALGTARIRSRS